MSQTLPANDFKWVEDNSEFNEDFIILKIYITFKTMIDPFCLNE